MKVSRLPSAIHSRRILNSPQFKAAFDVTRINLKSRSEMRCKTEGALKTEHGTCTTEDDLLSHTNVDIWSVLSRKDFYFTQSPQDITLLQYCENEVQLTFLDLKTMECNREYGVINQQGQIKFSAKQLLFKQTKLLYISLKFSQKWMQSNLEVQQNFKYFLQNLWQGENKKLCFACYFDLVHILIWDTLKQTTWVIYGQDLDTQHSRMCFSSANYSVCRSKRQKRINNENICKQHSKQQSFHNTKLIIEDKMNFVMDFIKPNIAEKDRINDIVTQIKCGENQKTKPKSHYKNVYSEIQ